MLEDFKKSKYYQYLFENHQEVFKDGDAFNAQIQELFSQKTDEMGTVLKCHLIVEYYIDQLLEAGYPTIKWKPVNLNFSKKLEMINTPGTAVGVIYYPAIKKLNTIRNKFAHNLAYELQESDLSELRISMDLWEKARGQSAGSGIQLIREFTVWVCGNISILTTGIKKHTPKTGLTGYLEWLSDMQSPVEGGQ